MARPDSSTDSIREGEPSPLRRAGTTGQSLENAIREGEPPLRAEQVRPEVRPFLSPRRLILGAVAVAAVVAAWHLAQPEQAGGLEVKYRLLLVEVVGPPEWEKKHAFSVRWQGKDLPLPVVFRLAGAGENFEMGSGGEIFGHLIIGKDKAPVTAKPDTKFQVRNTGIIAFFGEQSSKKSTVALSIVTSVAMSPPEHPGELSPIAQVGERESAGKKLETRIKRVIAAGSVVDVQPAR